MSSNVSTDTNPKAEAGVSDDELVQLAVNVGFYTRPFFVDPDDSTSEEPMKVGPPFVRFPVQLSTKDAGIIQQLLTNSVAFIAFEIQQADGKPGYYRLIAARD